MKKFVLFIIIVNLSFAGGNIVYKKTKTGGNTLYETLVSVKKGLIGNVNFFIPDYLKINPEESFFYFNITYNSLSRKLSESVSLHLKLPGLNFSRIVIKNSPVKQKNGSSGIKNKTVSTSFTIRPYISIGSSKPEFFIKNSFLIQKKSRFTYAFNQQLYYYPFKHGWEEDSVFIVKKKPLTLNISVSRNNSASFFTYTAGIYRSFIYKKRLYILGYSFTGYTDTAPFCYTHKLSLVFRHTLKSKKVYVELQPYLLYSKIYGYHLKEAINISLNYKF
jgi:hypothetical protein